MIQHLLFLGVNCLPNLGIDLLPEEDETLGDVPVVHVLQHGRLLLGAGRPRNHGQDTLRTGGRERYQTEEEKNLRKMYRNGT